VREGQLDLLCVGLDFVARDAVEADFADAEHRGPVEELGDALEHLARVRSSASFGFMAIQA
jgi:hypothetical protein